MRHTATLLPSGQVLVAGGGTATVEIFDPQTGLWTQAESMFVARAEHTATRLLSGEVLIVGGDSLYGSSSSAEIFDPMTGHWSFTGSTSSLRSGHSAAPLADGRVLVSGGQFVGTRGVIIEVDTAEIYDPATRLWSPTRSMTHPRANATATLLPDSRVLVVGSLLYPEAPITEIYDPATETWNPDRQLETDRVRHTTTLLSSGKVLVAGGVPGPTGRLASTELLDPLRVRLAPESAIVAPRASVSFTASGGSGLGFHWELQTNDSGATLTSDGHYTAGPKDQTTDVVRVTDSVGGSATANVSVVAGTWEAVGSMATPRHAFPATGLKDGRVLVVGGEEQGFAEIYDPTARSWSDAGFVSESNFGAPSLTVLDSGLVLLSGGCCFIQVEPTSKAWLYDPGSRTLRGTGSMLRPRSGHAALRLQSGRVLVIGGGYAVAEEFDPRRETWDETGQPASSVPVPSSLTLLESGKALLVHTSGPAEVYDPSSRRWHLAGSMSATRNGFATTRLASGKVLVVGGTPVPATPVDPQDPQIFVPVRAEIFDPSTETWTVTGAPKVPRFGHTVTLLASGEVLVAGGWVFEGSPLPSASAETEIYNEGTGSFRLAGPLREARGNHSATLLPSGRVLVAGGIHEGAQLKSAEEFGVTQANVDQMKSSKDPFILRLLGQEGDTGKALGLDEAWAYRAIKAVGNYGEMYDRHFGPKALNLPRGLNNLYTQGGLHYPLPIR